ncbi:Omega-amidase chloroplastic [Zea mays]|uniref:Omega-amidase chloroplastic n=1 Tax=Zea mays TaxID=4577 RepID=A0A1D6JQB4_MAIZE|nr:Omega-amidase chloroplastic [Zea mays]
MGIFSYGYDGREGQTCEQVPCRCCRGRQTCTVHNCQLFVAACAPGRDTIPVQVMLLGDGDTLLLLDLCDCNNRASMERQL